MPRFIITRCIANVAWRRCGGESAASIVDWAGQKKPLPIPVTTRREEPLPRRRRRARTPRSRRRGPRATIARIARPPSGRRAIPKTGPATMLTTAFVRDDQPGRAEADAPHVVEVDEEERDQACRSRTRSRARRPAASARSGGAAGRRLRSQRRITDEARPGAEDRRSADATGPGERVCRLCANRGSAPFA